MQSEKFTIIIVVSILPLKIYGTGVVVMTKLTKSGVEIPDRITVRQNGKETYSNNRVQVRVCYLLIILNFSYKKNYHVTYTKPY